MQARPAVLPFELHALARARRGIEHRESKGFRPFDHGSKHGRLLRLEQALFIQGSGGVDPGHDTLQQFRALAKLFLLFGDGHFPPGSEHDSELLLQLMPREACHRNWGSRRLVSRGEGQPQHVRANLGIVVKQFVEIAHAKEEDRVGVRRLQFGVLVHHRALRHGPAPESGLSSTDGGT